MFTAPRPLPALPRSLSLSLSFFLSLFFPRAKTPPLNKHERGNNTRWVGGRGVEVEEETEREREREKMGEEGKKNSYNNTQFATNPRWGWEEEEDGGRG